MKRCIAMLVITLVPGAVSAQQTVQSWLLSGGLADCPGDNPGGSCAATRAAALAVFNGRVCGDRDWHGRSRYRAYHVVPGAGGATIG